MKTIKLQILALPEHFSPKHLQAIVDGKMKDGDKVLVECELESGDTPAIKRDREYWSQIKFNSSNHVTLHKIEEKMYTKDQVHEFIHDFASVFIKNTTLDPEEWFEQNVK